MKYLVTERLKLKDLYPDRAKDLAKESDVNVDDLELVRKGVIADKTETDDEGVISFISMEGPDRDNDEMDPDGVILSFFNKNKVVPYGHDYRGLPVGKSMWIKKATKNNKRGLLAKTVFLNHQFAQEVGKLYTEDVAGTGPAMKGWSIGFIPLKWEEPEEKGKPPKAGEADTRPRRKYTKWELVEYSAVMIPSCREALTEMVEKGLIKSEKLKKDIAELIEIEDDPDELELTIESTVEPLMEYVCPKCEGSCGIDDQGFYCQHCEWVEGDGKDEVQRNAILILKRAITKPEEIGDLIYFPATGEEGKHRGHKIRWITVSSKEGIRGIYCIDCKKIITFVFDKKKGWTMAKARKWMKDHGKAINIEIEEFGKDISFEDIQKLIRMEDENRQFAKAIEKDEEEVIELEGDDGDIKSQKPAYKERWNKSLPKVFDVSEMESPKPKPFSYELYGKFLDCKIKQIFKNTYSIPSPLIGTYLAGLKEILSRFDLKDTRNFSWDGMEMPPEYEVIQLNSTQSDDFLMNGIRFYNADEIPLIVKYIPEWNGFNVSFITSSQHKEWNKELLTEVHKWVEENNFLKGEKFSLSGEFLDKSEDDWDNLVLKPEAKDIIRKSVNYLIKKGGNLASRGLLFIGPPGTGKTKTGRVLMNKADATFIWVSSRDFRRVGPLSALTLSFSLARQLLPTILFIEDIDTWLKDYGNQDSVVVDLLKTELDGIKQNKGIINILTSNYPEKLPDTLLDRPGRFHHIVNFELPQAEQRKEMLILWAGEIENELLEKIVKETEEFSGAHIRELVDYAYIIAEEDDIDIGEAIVKSLEKLREQRDLISEIRENKKSLMEILTDKEVIELELKGVIPFKDTGKAPEDASWNGPKEIREAEVSDLKIMCTWFDSENPNIKGAYKLPHHQAKGHKVVWRAVAAAMAAFLGARGGVQIPDKDRKGVYDHLAKSYKQFDKEPPGFREYTEEELKELFSDDQQLIDEIFEKKIDGRIRLTEEVAKRAKEDFKENMDENGIGKVTQELWNSVVDQLKESDVAEEIAKEALLELHQIREEIRSLKEGRILSAKNRKLIQDILTAMEAVIPPLKSLLTATEPPKEEEFEIDIDKDEGTDNEGKDAKGKPEKLEIDTEQLTAIVQGVFQNNLDKIGELVADRIAKAKGRVG